MPLATVPLKWSDRTASDWHIRERFFLLCFEFVGFFFRFFLFSRLYRQNRQYRARSLEAFSEIVATSGALGICLNVPVHDFESLA